MQRGPVGAWRDRDVLDPAAGAAKPTGQCRRHWLASELQREDSDRPGSPSGGDGGQWRGRMVLERAAAGADVLRFDYDEWASQSSEDSVPDHASDSSDVGLASPTLRETPAPLQSYQSFRRSAYLDAQLKSALAHQAHMVARAAERCQEAEERARGAEAQLEVISESFLDRIKELEAELTKGQRGCACIASMPTYWAPRKYSRRQPVHYIDLYRRGLGSEKCRIGARLDEELVAMMDSGVTYEDAVAALEVCSGDVDAAVSFQIECLSDGGAAAVVSTRLEDVLHKFEEGRQGRSRSSVVCVQQVQNERLWRKYCMRKQEIEEDAGKHNVNERMLWHGSGLLSLEAITRDGFDHRLSNIHGALGAGTYFSVSSGYSHQFSAQAPLFGGPGVSLRAAVNAASRSKPCAGKNLLQASVVNAPGQAPVVAMLLCRVSLGRSAPGRVGLRRPPEGADSVAETTAPKPHGQRLREPTMHAVFDNAQAYPEYLVYYRA
ncbi:unnamed protein product [Ostreobium quekettii]|uniref:Poly [ADP-ribose] polymerase n=1 Tax=Ostreobium quekettii TaxID=121088 RepID=A0A8S1IYM9_9CHLO|nr:unnamed protein product [Ostreobium quekettii]